MDNLENSLHELTQTTKVKKIYGILGIPIGGVKTVEVPNRDGFVYVRLRDNQSELIQAVNSEVSPVYDLPVVLVRQGNRYVIEGRDVERYQNWGSVSSFLPRHAEQHSFNVDSGGGGDVVFVYGKQIVPMLAIPSGSFGANNVILSEYTIQNGSTGWIYSGGTGTQNLLNYKPGGSNAVMILVYVDQTTGNPGILVGSGSYFSNAITGSAQVTPYIPANTNSNYLPAMAVRLTSGTSVIGWDNLYDVRQYYGGSGGGASTGSSSNVPLFTTGSVPYSGNDGILKETNSQFSFDDVNKVLWVGTRYNAVINNDIRIVIRATGTNTVAGLGLIAAGTGTLGGGSPTVNGYKSRGTFEVPTPVQEGDALLTIIGAGHDGVAYQNASRIRMYANRNFITGSNYETRLDFEVTPSGSATRIPKLSLYGDSLNLINTGTYNVNGSPHAHASPWSAWLEVNEAWTFASASTINIPTGGTGRFKQGMKIRFKQGGSYKYYVARTIASTLITVIINTDYTVANSAITNIAISYHNDPEDFPVRFNYDGTLSASTTPPTGYIKSTFYTTFPWGIKCSIGYTWQTGSTQGNGFYLVPIPFASSGFATGPMHISDISVGRWAGVCTASGASMVLVYGTLFVTNTQPVAAWALNDTIDMSVDVFW